jgi:hypothetical protein
MIHSNQGIQYASDDFKHLLLAFKFVQNEP